MERKPQTYQNHAKYDPWFHFVLAPAAIVALLGMIYHAIHDYNLKHVAYAVAALWAVVAIFKTRLYSLKVQDRVIRLEERVRLAALLPEPLRSRCLAELSISQLIGLRFASDAELPALAAKALDGNLSGGDIKKQVKNWRPDYWRV